MLTLDIGIDSHGRVDPVDTSCLNSPVRAPKPGVKGLRSLMPAFTARIAVRGQAVHLDVDQLRAQGILPRRSGLPIGPQRHLTLLKHAVRGLVGHI